MRGFLEGLTRSETFLNAWEFLIAGPEEVAGPALPLRAQLTFARQTIRDAAQRVTVELQAIPDQLRFHTTSSTNAAEDTVAAIRRNLPEGYTPAFEPAEADTMQMWNNLPRFGRSVVMTELEQATLEAPPNMRPRSFAENVERSMDEIDAAYRAEMQATRAATEARWQGINERAGLKLRVWDIQQAQRREGWTPINTELEPGRESIEMTTMGTIPEDTGALDMQRLVLADPEVERAMGALRSELNNTYLAMQDINEHGMGMLSDGTLLSTEEPVPSVSFFTNSLERQEILAAGKTALLELEEVTVSLGTATEVASTLENVFQGVLQNPLNMHEWSAPSIARTYEASGMLDEFSAQLPVLEPIDIFEPVPPPELVADFAAVDLEEELFLAPAAAAAVEEGAVAAGVAVAADAAEGTVLSTFAGAVVEAGWGLAGAIVGGVAVTAVSVAFMGMMAFNNRSRGDAPAPLGRPGTVMNPEIRQTAGTIALFGHRGSQPTSQQVAASAARSTMQANQAAKYNAAHGAWVDYIQRVWRRRAMANVPSTRTWDVANQEIVVRHGTRTRYVVMDPQTGLFRNATVLSYTMRATIWSEATDADWEGLSWCQLVGRQWQCPIVIPRVSLPEGQAAWGSVVWPPENQDFHMEMEGVSYQLHLTDINRIHGSPMTATQLEWNRRASASPDAGRIASELALAAFFRGPATRQKFGLYKHAVATRHSMHGQHYVLMDPHTALWRVFRCSDYRMNPTRWTLATQMVDPMGEITWPPQGESWRFGPPATPPYVFADRARVQNRAMGSTVTEYRLIHNAPMTDAQQAWNRQVLEMQRIRLGQRLGTHIIHLINQALAAAHGSSVPNIVTSIQNRMPAPRHPAVDQLPAGRTIGGFSDVAPSVPGLDEAHLHYSIRKQISEHIFTKDQIIAAWSQHYSPGIVTGLATAAFNGFNADPANFILGVQRESAAFGTTGTRSATRRRLDGSTGLGQSLVPGQGGLSEPAHPAAHKPIVMGGLTPGQLNREIRRIVDLGTFPAGAVEGAFGQIYGHDNAVALVAAAESAKVANSAAFHTAVRAENRPAARRAADAIEANIPGGPGVRVVNIRPVIGGAGADTGTGRPGPGALVPLGAHNIRPADILAEAGGHHSRHRHTEVPANQAAAFAAAVFTDVSSDYHFVPTFNPADFDKGISSHSLAASSSASAVATTQSASSTAVGTAPSAFWHTVGTVFKAGRVVAGYYMGNDPCRVEAGRRRLVASAESQLAVRPNETYDQWANRNNALIWARGADSDEHARALYARNEPPALSQRECVTEPTAVGDSATGPEIKTIDWPGETAGCDDAPTVHLGPQGGTQTSTSGPKPTTTATAADKGPCPEGKPDSTQDYTLGLVGVVLLVAVIAVAMN